MAFRRAPLALAAALALSACGGSEDETGDVPPLPPPLIHGWVMTFQGGTPQLRVLVSTSDGLGTAIADAEVTINSATLAWNPAQSAYVATGPLPGPGDDVVLTVTIPAGSTVAAGAYTATGPWFPTVPSVSSPASASTWAAGVDNPLTWYAGAPTSGTPSPVHYVGVREIAGADHYPGPSPWPFEAPASTTSFTVPAGTLPAGSYALYVGIGTPGLFTGSGGIPIANAAEGSTFGVGRFSSGTYWVAVE